MAKGEVVNYFGSDPKVPDETGGNADAKRAAREAVANAGNPDEWTEENLSRGAWVEIDLGAVAHNVRVALDHLGPRRQLMAVVKADAYGHGAVRVAQTALKTGASYLGVATVEEAVELREAGLTAPILVLSQPPVAAIPTLLKYDVMPAVATTDFALALGEAADLNGMVAKYHLAVDSGMNRTGVFYLDVVDFLQAINFHRGLKLEGVFTHFATSDEESDWDFRIQLGRFNDALQLLSNARIDPGVVHAANSAAIARYPEAYFDMGRLGISMYGVAPSKIMRGTEDLHPVMSVKARLMYVKEPQMGEGVSYGMNYRVAKPVQIGTIPLGYADGVRRCLSSNMKVLCNGRVCRQVGNICMDQMMIEIPLEPSSSGKVERADFGDEVVLIGRQGDLEITADTMADALGTIDHEVFCLFGLRLPRIYV